MMMLFFRISVYDTYVFKVIFFVKTQSKLIKKCELQESNITLEADPRTEKDKNKQFIVVF